MFTSANGGISSAGRYPIVGTWIVSAAVGEAVSTPDDHFSAAPDGGVIPASAGRVSYACSCPSICVGIISPACVQSVKAFTLSAPHDHFVAGPNCCVKVPNARRIGHVGGSPIVRTGVVSAARVQKGDTTIRCPAPDDHFTACPHSSMGFSSIRHISDAGSCPTVGNRIVSPASMRIALRCTKSAPHNHFTTCPDGSVAPPSARRIRCSHAGPSV